MTRRNRWRRSTRLWTSAGINFFDTADGYGDGRSERLLGRLRKERKEPFYIVTKAGRRLPVQTPKGYNPENLSRFVEDSLPNLQMDCVDIVSREAA